MNYKSRKFDYVLLCFGIHRRGWLFVIDTTAQTKMHKPHFTLDAPNPETGCIEHKSRPATMNYRRTHLWRTRATAIHGRDD